MDKNVFAKNKKYNPDVIINMNKKEQERDNIKFKHSEQFFNVGNSRVDSLSKQLNNEDNYKKDIPNFNLDKEIEERMNERINQEILFKGGPNKTVIPNSNPNEFHQFNDLKNNDERVKKDKEIAKQSNEHNDMMQNLKDLGILN